MANTYSGYCIDCSRDVRAGHGELVKKSGKWVVSCGRKSQPSAATPARPAGPSAPEGMRLTDLRLSSSNAALTVNFGVSGSGQAYVCAGSHSHARLIHYTNKSNDELLGKLKAAGQIAYTDSDYESRFPLSAEEQRALVDVVEAAWVKLISAILDGSADIEVREVGCDFPHPQITRIVVDGEPAEYALIQHALGAFGLAVDGKAECADLAAAIRAKQTAGSERAEKLAEHRTRRADGHHIVLLRRCWECGRTQILGEYDDDMRIVRMPQDVHAAALAEQAAAHRRSYEASQAAGASLLSSVGFDPARDTKFEFRTSGESWYCGC